MKVWADEENRFQDLLAADPRIQKWLKPKGTGGSVRPGPHAEKCGCDF